MPSCQLRKDFQKPGSIAAQRPAKPKQITGCAEHHGKAPLAVSPPVSFGMPDGPCGVGQQGNEHKTDFRRDPLVAAQSAAQPLTKSGYWGMMGP